MSGKQQSKLKLSGNGDECKPLATGELSAAVMKQDENMVKQRENVLSVESYIKNRGLADDLSRQIRTHFDFLAKSAAFEGGGGGGQQAGAYTRPLLSST